MRTQHTPRLFLKSAAFLLASVLVLSGFGLFAAERQFVAGHLPKAAATLQSVGRLPASKEMRLAIALPLRNQQALSNLLTDLYDPSSPRYHQYLTPDQFTEQFGPTVADYEALAAFAEANGLRVTARYSNRTLLDVKGSVAAIENTFHLNLLQYPHPSENRTFFAPDKEPALDFNVPVLHITGLTDIELPRPANLRRPGNSGGSGGTPADGSGPGGSYRGNDFRRTYAPGVTLNGAGQMVGLLEFDTYYLNDITAYRRNSGITTIPLINVFIDQIPSTPGANNIEVALDIEVANAMAPGLAAIIIYAGGFGDDILNRMATDNLAKQLSASWTFGASAATDQIYQQFAAQGQTYFNASGDGDAYTGAVSSPVDHPFVIAVGGTTLTTGTSASYISETTWNWGNVQGNYVGTGGGVSTTFPIPSWQQGIASMATNGGSATFRNVPDVAMIADQVYVVYNNGTESSGIGGTSVSAPLWAGYTAMINQQAVSFGQPIVGFLNPSIYAIGKGPGYSTNFHDITTGDNTKPTSPTKFLATQTYDLCTGWGSPIGSNTINTLAPRINARVLVSGGTSIASEGCSPGNSVVDPNELVTINFSLKNNGAVQVTNLVAMLQTSGGVLSPSSPQNYGAMGAGVTVSRPFSFTANGACGGTIVATLQLQDGADNLGTLAFNFPLGKVNTTLTQNFEPLTIPALPTGWTTTTADGGIAWVTSNTLKDTTPNAAFAAEPTTAGVTELLSPIVAISSSNAQLSFKQNYNCETDPATLNNAFDGGVLEIKIGAGAFQDILAAGGSFASNGYNRSINVTNTDNPLFGRQVWSALSPGFITTTVNLPAAAAGQTVQFKWRLGTDNGNFYGGSGWYVDTVALRDGSTCCVPMADLVVSQAPSTNVVLLGQNLSYSLSISNLGLQAVSSVSITDAIPPNVTFSSASPGCVFTNGMVICNLGAMNAGGSNGVTVTVTPLAVGFVTNIVTVGSELFDPATANNSTTNVTSVTTNLPPAFTLQPTNTIVLQGGNASFQVSASGAPAPGYQWLFNGTNLLSATTSTLSLNNVQAANIGDYQAVATNVGGSATSSVAHLTVLIAPSIHLTSLGANGTNVTISVDSVAGLNYRLEYKNLLTDPAWTPVVPAAPGTGSSVVLLDTNAPLAPTRFYRVSAF